MTPRRDRSRTTALSLTHLEDRSVPSATVAIPTPLTPTTITAPASVGVGLTATAPIGWQSYAGSATGEILLPVANVRDIATFTLPVDAGTKLTVIVDSVANTLRPIVTVTGPLGGAQTATATATGVGKSVEINSFDANTTGTYIVSVSGVATSAGTYRVRVLLGTADETETITSLSPTPITNDSTPQNLDASLIDLGGGARGTTVNGLVGRASTSSGGTFIPGDNLDNYVVTVGAGQTLSVGLQRVAGTNTTFQIVGSGTSTALPAGGNFYSSQTLPNTNGGTYTIQVSGFNNSNTPSDPYLLSVVVGGVIDQEPNDTVATAQAIPLITAAGNTNVGGGVARGGIGTIADVDYYSFTVPPAPPPSPGVPPAPAGQAYAISTRTPADGAGEYVNNLVPAIELQDATGVPITTVSTQTGSVGRSAVIYTTGTLAPGTTYLIRVTGGTSGVTGEYNLVIDQYTITPANPPTTTVPTAENLLPIAVSAGGPYTITEGGGSIPLQATGTDPNGDPLTFNWDLNNDGVFTDASGPTPSISYATLQALGVGDGTRGYAFFVQASDSKGLPVSSLGTALTVTNAPPTGTLAVVGSGSVDEGSTATQTVRVGGATDPSSVDAASLRYSFDFDNDGVWDVGDGTYANSSASATAIVPASYFADNGTVTVSAIVIDKDGAASTPSTATFTVNSVPPTATLAAASYPEGTTGVTVALTNQNDVSTPDRVAGYRYSYSFNGAAIANTSYAAASADPNVPIPDNFFADGRTTFTVTIRIFDKDSSFRDITQTFTVTNVAPTAAVTNSGPVNEGGTATVTASATDPSGGDTAAGFRYSYDFNNDGTWELGNGLSYNGSVANATPTIPATFLADGSAAGTPLTVRVRAFDRNNDSTDATTVVTINNVAPTATFNAPASAVIGTPVTVSLTGVADPSTRDTAAGFRYSFDLNNDGDFSDAGEVSGSATASATVRLLVPGTVTIRGRVTDKDGGSTDYTRNVTVSDVPPTVDSISTVALVNEGSTSTVSVSASHPSVTGPTTALRYSYDFNDDGIWDVGDGASYAASTTSNVVTIPASFLDDGPGGRTVRVRVFEAYGLSADSTAATAIRNVAPTATLTGPTGRVEVFAPVTFTFSNVFDPSAADTAAGLRYSLDLNGNGSFADPGDVLNSTSPVIQTAVESAGVYTVRGVVTDKDGGSTTYTATLNALSPVKVVYAVGGEGGNAPIAKLYNAQGQVVFENIVFAPAANGGVRVAAGDVNNDGVVDLIAGTGPGAVAEIKVIDGRTGATLFSARPFGAFTGGVFVAAGDLNGDGFADFAVSPDQGGGPQVIVYSGQTYAQSLSFFGIDDPGFRGGARVGMADINGDGRADLLVSAGAGGGPRVAGYDGQTLFTTRQRLFNDFFAFDPALRNGVYLAGGDLDGDGKSEIVAGAGPGGGPQVIAFSGAGLMTGQFTQQATFFGSNVTSRAGIRVAVADVDGDGRSDIITGEADGPRVNIYLANTLTGSGPDRDPIEFLPFSAPMNGIFVG